MKGDAGFSSTPNLAGLVMMKDRDDGQRRPSLEMELVSDIGDNKPMGGGYVGAIPASFATQMAYATGALSRHKERNEEQDMLSRIMMARMNSLEEGFREVVHEMRENLKRQGSHSRSRSRSRSRERRHANAIANMQPRKGKERLGVVNKDNKEPGTRTPQRKEPISENVSRPASLLSKPTEVTEEKKDG